jgi:hypothetical protein
VAADISLSAQLPFRKARIAGCQFRRMTRE